MKVLGNLNVIGQLLNLKPEVLATEPTLESLGTAPRMWVHENSLKFFNGAAITNLSAEGLTAQDITDALVPYAKSADVTSEITNAVADLVSTSELSTALGSYSTTAQMTTAIENALAGLDFQADVIGTEDQFSGVAGRYIFTSGSNFNTGEVATQNDIVEVDEAGTILAVAYDVSVQGDGTLVWNSTSKYWMRYNGANWAEFGGLVGLTGENGVQVNGGVVSIKLDGNTLTVGPDGLKVGDLSATYATVTALAEAVRTAKTFTKFNVKFFSRTVNLTSINAGTSVAGRAETVVEGDTIADVNTGDIYTIVSGSRELTSALAEGEERYINATMQLFTNPSDRLIAGRGVVKFTKLNGVVTSVRISTSEGINLRMFDAGGNDTTIEAAVNAVNTRVSDLESRVVASYVQFDPSVAGTVLTVTHNLGNKYPMVQVVNADDTVILVDEIKFIDANTLTVTIAEAGTPKVIVQGLKAA